MPEDAQKSPPVDVNMYSNEYSASAVGSEPHIINAVTTETKPSNKTQAQIEYDKLIDIINAGMKVAVIIRGAPGSGKSYLANRLFEETVGEIKNINRDNHIFNNDKYLYLNGSYKWDLSRLLEARELNLNAFREAVRKGVSPVIVDNPNTKYSEFKPYVAEAFNNGYYVKLISPNTPWARNVTQLFKRNIHNVPKPIIEEFLHNLEENPNVDENQIKDILNLEYPKGIQLPQLRNYPPVSNITGSTL